MFAAGISKPLIFVVISVLVVALVHSSYSGFEAFAEPKDPKWDTAESCVYHGEVEGTTCCWGETDILDPEGEAIIWCQTCKVVAGGHEECGPVGVDLDRSSTGPLAPLEDGVLEQPPTPPPTGPFVPPQGGVLQQPPVEEGGSQPLTRGQEGVLPPAGVSKQPPAEQGTTEPPATEGAQPAIVEEEPAPVCPEGLEFNEDLGFCVPEDCPEGQVLDEESGICVLEQPEAAEEEPEQAEPEEQDQQQSSEEGAGSEEQ
jgi:hypothetical protein